MWFSQAIKRHSFITWLVIQDRLSTQNKLLKWGLINSISCVFCQASVEYRNHLFFECQVTAGIWMRVLRLCGQYRLPRRWENEFRWVTRCKGNSFCSISYGDSEMLECMTTFLFSLSLFSLSFVMMSGSELQAFRM